MKKRIKVEIEHKNLIETKEKHEKQIRNKEEIMICVIDDQRLQWSGKNVEKIPEYNEDKNWWKVKNNYNMKKGKNHMEVSQVIKNCNKMEKYW